MASLKRVTHKNGRVVYRIVICLGYDGQGNKRVRNFTYPVNQSLPPRQQEKEALKYAMNMEDKIKYGYDIDSGKIMFEDFACQWLDSVRDNLAYGTYVGYEQLLRSRILAYFKEYKMANIRTLDIEAFYRTLARDYSAGTIKRYVNVLNCIFRAAGRWNVIESSPCQYAQKPKKIQGGEGLRYFTPQQSLMFLKSLNMSYNIKCSKRWADESGKLIRVSEYEREYRVSTQFKLFFTLSIFCGFRKGETLALHWSDIDLEHQNVSISKAVGRTENGFDYKEPKNSSALRRIPLPQKVCGLLEDYKKEYDSRKLSLGDKWKGDGSLFIQADGKRMGHTTTYQYFVRHLQRYNQWVRDNPQKAQSESLEELPHIPLHGLRHSCATLLNYLQVNIVDISKYLGHANCSTTMNIYAHSFEAQRQAASDKLNNFMQEYL